MSAEEETTTKETVPLEMLSRFNAKRADWYAAKEEAAVEMRRFQAALEGKVGEFAKALNDEAAMIAKAMGLDTKAGDKFDPSTGIVTRGEAK